MAYEWFKLFTEARTDAKLRTLTDGQHRIWFNLLCFAAERPERGVIAGYDDDLLAIEVANGDTDALADTISRLAKLRILARAEDGTLSLINWNKRQNGRPIYPSDTAEETRKRKQDQRARDQLRDVTSRHESSRVSRQVTGIEEDVEGEGDTDPEGEAEADSSPAVIAASDLPAVAGGGASAPGVGGTGPTPLKTDGLPETARPPLTLVPQTATPRPPQPVPRRATDASELAAFIPLARQVAEAAKLTTYDALALARTVRKHQAHEPDILLLEAGKAAEWCGRKKKPMSVTRLDHWFTIMDNQPKQVRGTNYADTRGRAGEERADATPTPDDEAEWRRAAERNRANIASVMASREAEARRLAAISANTAQAAPAASMQRLQ